jgi:general L-amino acid transport system permease protein
MQQAAAATAAAAEGPPAATTGVLGWVRKNLFSSWLNAALTALIVYVAYLIVPPALEWAVFGAKWTPGKPDECSAITGACWPLIHEKYRLMLFGRYPFEDQWRSVAAIVLLIGSIVMSCNRAFWKPWLGAFWVAVLAVFFWLLAGGPFVVTFGRLALLLGAAALVGSLLGPAKEAGIAPGLRRAGLVLLVVALVWDQVDPLLKSVFGVSLGLDRILGFTAAVPSGLIGVPTNLWGGLTLTLMLSVFGIAAAFPLAILLALGRRSNMPAIKMLCVGYIEMIRGVPLISLLFVASFLIPLFLPSGVNFSDLLRAQIAIIGFTAAYLAEVIRGGLQAIPRGQYEAAEAMGLGYWQSMFKIILPQAIRLVIPPIVNTFIGLFKDTSLVGIVGLTDYLLAVQSGFGDGPWRRYFVEGYVFAAVVYFIFCFALSKYSQYLETKFETGRQKRR